MVLVSPGILETNVMVAPNSPNEHAKANTIPTIIPGDINGNVMVKKPVMDSHLMSAQLAQGVDQRLLMLTLLL